MIRTWLLAVLTLAACAAEPECLISSRQTGRIAIESDVAPLVSDGGLVASFSLECSGWCVRDATVTPLEPHEAAVGYCAPSCAFDGGCPSGTSCRVVGAPRPEGVCVRD
jgi:hypothetical protein